MNSGVMSHTDLCTRTRAQMHTCIHIYRCIHMHTWACVYSHMRTYTDTDARSGFEPATFGFPDVPEQEADALLIRPPRLVPCTDVFTCTYVQVYAHRHTHPHTDTCAYIEHVYIHIYSHTYLYVCVNRHIPRARTCAHAPGHVCRQTHTPVHGHVCIHNCITHNGCVHTQMCACTDTRAHAQTDARANITHVHIRIHTPGTYIRTWTQIYVHRLTYTHKHMYIHRCIRAHTYIHLDVKTPTHARMYMHTHAYIHAYIHICT